MKSLSKFIHFRSRKCILKMYWKISVILSRPQYVNDDIDSIHSEVIITSLIVAFSMIRLSPGPSSAVI